MYASVDRTEEAIAMYSSLVEKCDLVAEGELIEFALEQLRELGAPDVECRIEPVG